jgi:hypothetical protein
MLADVSDAPFEGMTIYERHALPLNATIKEIRFYIQQCHVNHGVVGKHYGCFSSESLAPR